MKRTIIMLTILLLVSSANFGLSLRAGLSLGYTPMSLNRSLADSVLADNTRWIQLDADAVESATVSTGSVPRNFSLSASGELMLSKIFFLQLDISYGMGLGGQRSVSDATANIGEGGGNRNADKTDSYSYVHIPLYFGIKQGVFRMGLGLNLTSVTYTQKATIKDASQVQDDGRSFDRSWSGTVIGWNILVGSEIPLSSKMALVFDLVYLAAPLELKYEGLWDLADTVTDVYYTGFSMEGWIMNIGVKIQL